jgi:sporulation protein YlmC with PRC-barrel domain
MKISALSAYGKTLLLSDSSRLGKIENFIVNKTTQEVDFLVIPEIAPRLIRSHAGNVVGMMSSQAVDKLKDAIPVEMPSSMIGSAGGSIGGMIATDVKKRLRITEENYYLIPTCFISSSSSESFQTTLNKDECEEWFLTPFLPPETYAAFYDSSHYKGPKRAFEIDLGLPSTSNIRTTSAKNDENDYIIKDMQIDTSTGKAMPEDT